MSTSPPIKPLVAVIAPVRVASFANNFPPRVILKLLVSSPGVVPDPAQKTESSKVLGLLIPALLLATLLLETKIYPFDESKDILASPEVFSIL